ncbi:MAG: phage tail tape measure protein [Desulfuromonadales bacterium]|nr:phage tail tape measure protein [Desulfuromonadales bacterium]
MADTKQTIDIIFQGIDRSAGAISSVIGNVEKGAGKLRDLAAPIADVTTNILKFEAAILTSGAALTLFAVKTAGDFDAAFREISTLIDAPLEELEGFRKGILDYSVTSTQSLDQITAGIYGAISAGVDYTDSLAFVSRAEKLAVASKADLGDTLVLLVSSLNAYGKGAESAEAFSDALFTTVKAGQTTLPELASSLAQVTGLAANAGVPFETLLSAVAALTAAGLPTSAAITGIKAALSNIIKPTEQAAEMAKTLGIDFSAAALNSKGFEGVLADVAKTTGGNVEQMAKLFGSVEGLNVVLSLTGKAADNFAGTMGLMASNAGATDAAFGKMADNINLQSQKIQNSVKAMLIGIGTPLLDEFGGMAEAIAGIFQAIGASVNEGELSKLVGYIEGLAGDMAATLQSIAQNMPEALATADFSGFIDGLEVVKAAILDLFDGADLTTVDGLKKAIEIVGTGFMTLSTFSASTVKAIGPFVEMLAELAKFVAELDPEIVKLAGSIGGMAIIAGPVLSALMAVSKAISAVAGAIVGGGGLAAALAAVATSPAGIALGLTAMGAASFELGRQIYGLSEHSKEYQKILGEVAEAEKTRVAISGQVVGRLAEISQQTGVAIDDMQDFNALVEMGVIVWDEASSKWLSASQSISQAATTNRSALIDWGAKLGDLSGSLDDNREAAIATAAAYYELSGTSPELARRMAELETPISKVEAVMAEAEKQTETFQTKMAELASNEKIKTMEFAVSLKIANLEADTKRIEAMFKSIDTTITSTGDLLGSLFDNLSGATNFQDKWAIKDQIEAENKRREEALELQKELTKAQIEMMDAKTRRLRDGDALIKITGDGLEPELEAFMWRILERIRVRANEEASEFLLGIG